MSRHDDDIATDTSGDDFELFPVGEPEEECAAHCGYVSSGQGLIDHMRWEHAECTECHARPAGEGYAVSHYSTCPRLQPGYAYPVPDPYGGHEFAYESSTDLFRCRYCRKYEVTVRQGEQIIPCEGDVPGEPMVLNAW